MKNFAILVMLLTTGSLTFADAYLTLTQTSAPVSSLNPGESTTVDYKVALGSAGDAVKLSSVAVSSVSGGSYQLNNTNCAVGLELSSPSDSCTFSVVLTAGDQASDTQLVAHLSVVGSDIVLPTKPQVSATDEQSIAINHAPSPSESLTISPNGTLPTTYTPNQTVNLSFSVKNTSANTVTMLPNSSISITQPSQGTITAGQNSCNSSTLAPNASCTANFSYLNTQGADYSAIDFSINAKTENDISSAPYTFTLYPSGVKLDSNQGTTFQILPKATAKEKQIVYTLTNLNKATPITNIQWQQGAMASAFSIVPGEDKCTDLPSLAAGKSCSVTFQYYGSMTPGFISESFTPSFGFQVSGTALSVSDPLKVVIPAVLSSDKEGNVTSQFSVSPVPAPAYSPYFPITTRIYLENYSDHTLRFGFSLPKDLAIVKSLNVGNTCLARPGKKYIRVKTGQRCYFKVYSTTSDQKTLPVFNLKATMSDGKSISLPLHIKVGKN